MDRIWGEVTQVIDGDTFDMQVTHIDGENEYPYNDVERIRIKGIDAPELDEAGGQRSKRALTRCLADEHIQVDIHTRDRYRRLVGDVTVE